MDKNTKGLKRLEAELIVNHAKGIKSQDSPVQIVKKALDSFSTIDTNDDGKLSEVKKQKQLYHNKFGEKFCNRIVLYLSYVQTEIEVFLEPRNIHDKDTILEEYSENVMTLLGYFDMLGKIQQQFYDLLNPFQKLDFLAAVEVKKVIDGSVKMFLENDEDNSGGLNKVR